MVVTELSGPEGIVAQEVPEPAAEGLVLIDVKASATAACTTSSRVNLARFSTLTELTP